MLIILLFLLSKISEINSSHGGIPIIEIKQRNIELQLISTLFMISLSLVKIFHALAHSYTKYIPESNILLIFGAIIGSFNPAKFETITSFINETVFFYVLLPPIILEASFSIYHKTFAINLIGVLVFAIIATVANFFLIAITLQVIVTYGGLNLNYTALKYGEMEYGSIWVFSSLIVAVDPVAVLAIFQEIHVDNNLYYLVFGESLLNDGVSVVLYEVMQKMSKQQSIEYLMIINSVIFFLIVCFGGLLIGAILSILSCLITRFTHKTPLSEPTIVIMLGYLAFIVSDTLGWSGIISMVTYGVIQAAYGFQNVTQKSLIVTKRLTKIIANLTESIIFLYIGMEVPKRIVIFWLNIEFILWSLLLCVYFRYVVTLFLTIMLNYFQLNVRAIQWNEMFIIAYGGLRGGIAYCLAKLTGNDLILDATLFIVIYTIIVMGFTMKPLVKMLSIKIDKPEELSLFINVNETVMNHLLAAVEEIIGMKGHNSFFELFKQIEEKYIRYFLQRDPISSDEKIMKTFEKMNMAMHMATTAPPGSAHSEYYRKKLKPQLLNYMMESRKSHDNLSMLSMSQNPIKHDYVLPIDPVNNRDREFQRTMSADDLSARMAHMLSLKKRSLQVTLLKPKKNKFNRLDSELSEVSGYQGTTGTKHDASTGIEMSPLMDMSPSPVFEMRRSRSHDERKRSLIIHPITKSHNDNS